MPDKPVLVTATRTVCLRVAPSANQGKTLAIESTRGEWAKAVRFYTDLFLEQPAVYAEKKTVNTENSQEREVPWTSKDLLTWAESQTVRTEGHAQVLRDFGEVCPQMPVVLRRAAINAASGAVHGHLSNRKVWEEADPTKRGREPRLPDPHPHLTLYQGMYELDEAWLRKGYCRLKLLEGGRWRWVNMPVEMPPYALDLFAQSETEKARIAACRAEQNARIAAEGRQRRTREEKERLRPAPGVWVAQSPSLIAKPGRLFLHVPFEKRVEIAGKADAQRQGNKDLKVGTFDLNADSAVGAAWEGAECIGIETIWHARENQKREKTLQRVARKQRRSGTPVKGEHSNRNIWAYLRNLDDTLAWRIASAIVAWAVLLGLQVLVFEYLRPYRPTRGLSWSRRANRRRAYWLRGKVLHHARHLALCQGILVVERNPAWTSQVCPRCSHLGERFSPGGRGYPSRFRCGNCGWSGDANVVAALNLKPKWDRTFRYPTAEEKRAAEQRRAGNGGAAVNPEKVPVVA